MEHTVQHVRTVVLLVYTSNALPAVPPPPRRRHRGQWLVAGIRTAALL